MARFGLDVGSSSTVVADAGGGFLLDEPSVMLRLPRGGGTVIGREAAELADRIPAGRDALRPVTAGVVTDLDTARRYVRAVLRRVLPRPWQRTRVAAAVVVPAGSSALERRALVEAVEEAGVSRAAPIPAPVAAALGCGLDPLDRRVHMVAVAGAGTAEVMAVCAGEVLAVRSTRTAGDALTAAVRRHVRTAHGLILDHGAAEDVTVRAGAAPEGGEVAVTGRDPEHGRPRSVRLPADELHAVLAPLVTATAQTLAGCLDDLPARAVDDLSADGVLLVGGASPTRGLRTALEAGLGLPVKQVENATTCVAEGAARSMLTPAVRHAYDAF
ncbi:rod shape-determining protein [Pseudonocardia xishanensis]|uniref:Rod shape-determining protein n=1 Tax=Pseudonocardia xishanensis TaxID=630995 RepID=A0ABP8RYG5_9PSEU